MRRKKMMAAAMLSALTLFGMGAWRVRHHNAAATTAAGAAAAAQAPFAFDWPKGKRFTYSFVWSSRSAVSLQGNGTEGSGGDLQGDMDLSGTWSVVSHGRNERGVLLEASIVSLDRHSATVLGKGLMSDDATADTLLRRDRAYFELTPKGVVRSVQMQPNASPLFRQMADHLATALVAPLRDDGRLDLGEWHAYELAPAGRAMVRYSPDAANRFELTRSRESYETIDALPAALRVGTEQHIEGTGHVTLDAAGYVRASVDRETLTVTRVGAKGALLQQDTVSRLILTSIDDVALTPIADDSLVLHVPGEHEVTEETRAQVLRQRIGGLDEREMVEQVERFGTFGARNGITHLVSRASGLVMSDPKAIAPLLAWFRQPTSTSKGRGLVFDILASAGTPEAQSAMWQALDKPGVALSSAERGLLVQRMSFVREPTAESMQRLADAAHDAPDVVARGPSLYALGSAVGYAEKAGRTEDVARYHAVLARALTDAKSPRDRAVAVAALGNAALEADATALGKLATTDTDAQVRASAAHALRSIHTPDASDALLAAAADPDPSVQRQALGALADESRAGDLGRLAKIVQAGSTSASVDADLVNAIAPEAGKSADARAMLTYVLARTNDHELASRIRSMLARVS